MTGQAFEDLTGEPIPSAMGAGPGPAFGGEFGPPSQGPSHRGPVGGTAAAAGARPGARRWWAWTCGVVLPVAALIAALIATVLLDPAGGTSTGDGGPDGSGSPASSAVDRTRPDRLLDAHAAALLAGNEPGWMDVADPTRPDVVAWYRQLYSTLRALRVTWLEYQIQGAPDGRYGPRAEQVYLRYCVGDVPCDWRSRHATTRLQLQFTERDDRWWVSDILDRADGWASALDPPPWLVEPLQVRRGNGVIVAAPAAVPAVAGKVDIVAVAAAKATGVVNRFARPGTTPPTYLIYLAGSTQWKIWRDDPIDNASTVGVTTTNSPLQVVVILNMDRITPDKLDIVLRHEMGHVITGFGESDTGTTPSTGDTGWAAEGIAEYISWTGQPQADYPRLRSIRTYVRTGRWNGILPIHIDGKDSLATDATYGLNYLIIRYLANTYSEPAMLHFIDELIRNGTTLKLAAREAFGQEWSTITTGITTHLQQIAR